MKKRKKNNERIKKPLVTRPCAKLVVGRSTPGVSRKKTRKKKTSTHDNTVIPSEVGQINGLGDQRETRSDVSGNKNHDRQKPSLVSTREHCGTKGGGV